MTYKKHYTNKRGGYHNNFDTNYEEPTIFDFNGVTFYVARNKEYREYTNRKNIQSLFVDLGEEDCVIRIGFISEYVTSKEELLNLIPIEHDPMYLYGNKRLVKADMDWSYIFDLLAWSNNINLLYKMMEITPEQRIEELKAIKYYESMELKSRHDQKLFGRVKALNKLWFSKQPEEEQFTLLLMGWE